MTEIDKSSQNNPATAPPRQKAKSTKLFKELCACFLWLYLVVKVFVFYFDVYFFQTYLQSYFWVIRFKFLIFLVLISVYLAAAGNKNFLKTAGYLLFYPFFLVLWRIPRVLFRNWLLMFSALSFLVSFFRSFRFNIITFTIVLVASSLILLSDTKVLVAVGSIALYVYLAWHFCKRFYFAFVPAHALFLPKETLFNAVEKAKDQFKLPNEIKTTAIDKFTAEQRNKWATNLQFLVILNEATRFGASKLKEMQERRIVILYFIFGLLFSLGITVVIFALNNYALQRIDPYSFSNTTPRGFGFFLYYSLNTILTNSIADFYPVSTAARLISTLDSLFGIIIIVILFFVYTNVKNDRTRGEIDALISSLEHQGTDMETFLNTEFAMDVDRAVAEIEKLPGSFIKVIYFFTRRK